MTQPTRARPARSAWIGGLSLAAATLAPPGLVPPARAADAAVAGSVTDAVVLEGLSFRRGHVTVEMSRVEARGTALTADGLRDILDPSSPLDLGQRLTRLSAASVAAPTVTLRRDAGANGAGPQVVTFHDVSLSDVRAGKVAAVSIGSVDGRLVSGDGEAADLSVGPVAAHAFDPQLVLQIATGSRADEDLPVSPVVHDVAVGALRLANTRAEVVEVRRIETGAIGGRPFLDTPEHLLRRLEERPGGLGFDMGDPLYRALADAALSVRLERLDVSGVGFSAPDGTAFRLADASLDVAGPGRFPSVRVDGAGLDAAGVHLSMKSAVLSGSGTAAVFTRAAALMAGQVPAAAVPPAVAPDAAGSVDLAVADVHLVLPPAEGGPFPPGTVNTVDVPSFVFGESASSGGATIEAHQRVEVRYDLPAGGGDPALQTMRDLGLSHLDVTFGSRMSYDANGRTVRLDELSLGGKGVGSVTLAGGMGDLPETPFRPGPTGEDAANRFAGATLRDVMVTMVDEGFIARALPILARQNDTTPAMLKAALKTKVDLALPDILGPTPTEAAVARAIDDFIDGGGTLTLAARSPKGASVSAMAGASAPSDLVQLFEVAAARKP